MTQAEGSARPNLLTGRLLSYTTAEHAAAVVALTEAHPRAGLVVRGRGCVDKVRRLRAAGWSQPLVVDLGAWSSKEASDTEPLELPGGGLFGVSVDNWADSIRSQGTDVVLTPSRSVRAGDWDALDAVLRAGGQATCLGLRTLVATDAEMLEPQHLSRFLATLASHHTGGDRLAFVFARAQAPLADRRRASGLRAVVTQHPGSLVIGVEVATGTDVLVHGGAAAIGVSSGLRRPRRPGDTGRPPATGYVPGLFLRDLWESRSPPIYSEWYANSASPTCDKCDGRAMDSFTAHPLDNNQIRLHNVHAWLSLLTEITRREPEAAREWLVAERLRAFTAHATLRPHNATISADKLLRALCELDDPQQRRTAPTGRWR